MARYGPSALGLRIGKFGLYLAAFMAVVDISVVYLALPAIGKSLGAGIADQQWIVNIYALMEGGFTLASGTLGDLYGRKRVFVGGVALFVAGAVGSALAMTPTVLIVARLVQGIGGAVLLSLSLALLTGMLADPKEDDDAVRTFSMTAGLGAVAGVVLGGVLVQFLGWRSIFAMSALFGALVLPLTLRYVPETARNLAQPVDVAGQLLSVLAFVALSLRSSRGMRAAGRLRRFSGSGSPGRLLGSVRRRRTAFITPDAAAGVFEEPNVRRESLGQSRSTTTGGTGACCSQRCSCRTSCATLPSSLRST